MPKSLLAIHSILVPLLFAGILTGCTEEPGVPVQIPTSAAYVPPVSSTSHKIKVAGEERSYLIHKSRLPAADPAPLVILLHGASDSADYALQAYRFGERSDEAGFMLAVPDGKDKTWRALDAAPNPDVDFLAAMIDEISAREKIDAKRVYIAGHSAGGAMAYRFAADHANRITAVGVVAGLIGKNNSAPFPKPARAVPVIAFHGDKDDKLNFEEYAVPAAKWWAMQNGCDDRADRQLTSEGITRWIYQNGKASVLLYEITNGNHMWPGAHPMPEKPTPPTAPDATDLMWNFFNSYPKK
jgi:polyhydroxybutyrate depolymerase